jgi:hypothetical protein
VDSCKKQSKSVHMEHLPPANGVAWTAVIVAFGVAWSVKEERVVRGSCISRSIHRVWVRFTGWPVKGLKRAFVLG